MAALTVGCGGGRVAPIEERHAAPPRLIDYHIVAPGETVYSIAWRYGLDYRRLARANGLGSAFRIRSGQRLTLDLSGQSPPIAARKRSPGAASPVPARPSAAPFRWIWPARGPVMVRFGSGAVPHKGIDIRGELGEPVLAAGAGTVVYAGSGLVGYGNLVIVKHNDRYLSAYGHNSRLLVAEGQYIKGGDRIADIGDSGTDRPKLHFEVRLDGRPVDPVEVLPTR